MSYRPIRALRDARWLSVLRCKLRGRTVDIEMLDGHGPAEPNAIRDTHTREALSWQLTPDEISALENVLTAP